MDRCQSCKDINYCPVCGAHIDGFKHIGVRGSSRSLRIPLIDYSVKYEDNPSGIWHYAQPCGHRVSLSTMEKGITPVYHGGPLWKDGYRWLNIYWGSYFSSNQQWMAAVDRATSDIETNPSYSGGLRQYNVGMGGFAGRYLIDQNPPAQIPDEEIASTLLNWISRGSVPQLGVQGAYNIFLPPGTYAILYSDYSCQTFCDYHNSANGSNGPFYTVEPFPCETGCNQCTSNPFDTLTMGLSEEMVELKTDMDPGTGWLIGSLELCDYCDEHFVCNQLSTGEYVNAWFDMRTGVCWKGR
jgi:hypothetical protein